MMRNKLEVIKVNNQTQAFKTINTETIVMVTHIALI